jgi:hypothetical protein
VDAFPSINVDLPILPIVRDVGARDRATGLLEFTTRCSHMILLPGRPTGARLVGIAISLWPMIVPLHALAGGFIWKHTGLSLDRHAVPATDHSDVHGLVLLGIPRQGRRYYWVSLAYPCRLEQLRIGRTTRRHAIL